MPASPKRYVAFLRGVSPLNAKMSELKRAFELVFEDVKTVRTSGNILLSARETNENAIARKAEAAMKKHLGRSFFTIVRSVSSLQALLETSPYAPFRLPRDSKRVVTFLNERPKTKPRLPLGLADARILAIKGRDVFSSYVAEERGPTLMTLLEKTFGKNLTIRTWQTLEKVAK
jgi:uncharacterized protein (DUF1697 family)